MTEQDKTEQGLKRLLILGNILISLEPIKPLYKGVEFYFNQWVNCPSLDHEIALRKGAPLCGTTACAIGLCPLVFPEDWVCDSGGYPMLKTDEICNPLDSARQYFHLDNIDASYLFMPTPTSTLYYNEEIFKRHREDQLLPTATAKEVGERIIKFANEGLKSL